MIEKQPRCSEAVGGHLGWGWRLHPQKRQTRAPVLTWGPGAALGSGGVTSKIRQGRMSIKRMVVSSSPRCCLSSCVCVRVCVSMLFIPPPFPPPLQWGGLDLNSSKRGCARLGSGAVPPLGLVKEEVAVLVVLVRRHRRAVGAAVHAFCSAFEV